MIFIRLLMPFIWEIILGKQTWKDAIKTNKMRLAMFLLIMSSFVLNAFLGKRVTTLASQVLECRKSYDSIVDKPNQKSLVMSDPPKQTSLNDASVQTRVLDELEKLDSKTKENL